MSQIDELIMIIPVVLNLKGNLEMNLSARLGTSANMGELDKPSTRRTIILGNLTLLQVQATVVSFIAACVSFALSAFLPHRSPTQITGETSSNSTVVLSITETLHDMPLVALSADQLVLLEYRGLPMCLSMNPVASQSSLLVLAQYSSTNKAAGLSSLHRRPWQLPAFRVWFSDPLCVPSS